MHSANLYKNICAFTCGTLNDKMRIFVRTKALKMRMFKTDPTPHKYCLGEQHLANPAISRWNTANVGFKPDKSLGAFGSRDLSALKPLFSVWNLYLFTLFFSMEIQPFSNYRITSTGLDPQLLILSVQFLSIPHSEIPAWPLKFFSITRLENLRLSNHVQKRRVYTWVRQQQKACRP
jgi:hypothetical protein